MPKKRLIRQTVKIGLFTLLAILILYVGITYLKGLSLSGLSRTYYVSMHDVTGINVATRVFVNGYNVGTVREIKYDYTNNGGALLVLNLNPDIKLPKGTTVQVTQTLLSGAQVNLLLPPSQGGGGAFLSPLDTIPVSSDKLAGGFAQIQQELLPQLSSTLGHMDSVLLQAQAILTNPNIEPALADVRTSAAQVKASTAQLQQSLRSLPTIMERIDHASEGVESFASELDSLQLQETIRNLESASRELKDFAQTLNQKESTVGKLLNEDGLYNRIDSVTTSLDALIQDIKANPKKYVKLSIF